MRSVPERKEPKNMNLKTWMILIPGLAILVALVIKSPSSPKQKKENTADAWGWAVVVSEPVPIVGRPKARGRHDSIELMQVEFRQPGSSDRMQTAFVNPAAMPEDTSPMRTQWKTGDEIFIVSVSSKQGGGVTGNTAAVTYFAVDYRPQMKEKTP